MKRFWIIFILILTIFLCSACDFFFPKVGSTEISQTVINRRSDGSFTVTLLWNWPDHADSFLLERAAPDDGQYEYIEIFWDDSDIFEDTGHLTPGNALVAGHTYKYRVRGYSNDAETGSWSTSIILQIPPFLPPADLSSIIGGSGDHLYTRLDWTAVNVQGVEYTVERMDIRDGTWQSLLTNFETFYIDNDVDPGYPYSYRVRTSHSEWGESRWGEELTATHPVPAPVLIGAEQTGEGEAVNISWTPVSDTEGDYQAKYKLYRAEGEPAGTYTPLWTNFRTPGIDTEISVYGGSILAVDDTVEGGTSYSYKVLAEISGTEGTLSLQPVTIETSGGVGNWINLGSDGFGSASGDVSLAESGGQIYALFGDAEDSETRGVAMVHSGDSGGWTAVGTAFSLAAADDDMIRAFSFDDTLYAVYGDTHPSVVSGGDSRLFVKGYDAGAWTSVGLEGGLAVEADEPPPDYWGIYGSEPSLTVTSAGMFLVYRTTSGGLAGSLSYEGGGDYWQEVDDEYWFNGAASPISAAGTAMALSPLGAPLTALKSGTTITFYQYQAESWEIYLNALTPTGVDLLEMEDFLVDGVGNYYLFWEGYSISGGWETVISHWNGIAWTDLGVEGQILDADQILGTASVVPSSGAGFISAVIWRTTDSDLRLTVFGYDGTDWSQYGPDIEPADGVASLDLVLDSAGRPVVVFAGENGGSLYARAWRE